MSSNLAFYALAEGTQGLLVDEAISRFIKKEPALAEKMHRLKRKLDAIEYDSKLARFVKENLDAFEQDFRDLVKHVRQRPKLVGEALRLKNRVDAIWYSSRLLSAESSNPEELEQSIRFIAESDPRDEQTANILDSFCWKNPGWLLLFPESLGKDLLMNKTLRKIRESAFLSRPAGARGNVVKCTVMAADKGALVRKIVSWYEDAPDETRTEIAMTLGEWGGEAELRLLRDWLHITPLQSESVKRGIISAVANIGGPIAIDILLEVAETTTKMTALAAMGSLEFLASGGSTALTEAPEPPIIDTRELWDAYKNLIDRLVRLSNSEIAAEYVRYKAGELLETIRPALRKLPAA